MQHARIAMYTLTGGSFDEIAARAERDLLEVFRAQPGFRAYGLARVEHARLVSISLWAEEAQANTAADTAARWVTENDLDKDVRLEATYIGDLAFWAAVPVPEVPAGQTPIPT
jgi:hypothetical protein